MVAEPLKYYPAVTITAAGCQHLSGMTDLKQTTARRQVDSVEKQTRIATNCLLLQPQFQTLLAFLSDLSERLNVVDPYVGHDYDILGYVALNELRQSRYVTRAEMDGELITNVVFECECNGYKPVHFFVDTRDACNTAKDRLLEHGLSIRWKDDANWRYVFTVQPKVPVSFEFAPHPNQLAIKLKAKNFQRLGVTTYSFEPQKLNDVLLDEFAKRVVNQTNSFDELSGYHVSNHARAQFQEAIAARQLEREEELRREQASTANKPNPLVKLFSKDEGQAPDPAQPSIGGTPVMVAPIEKPLAPASSRPPPKPKSTSFKKYAWMVTGTGDGGESTTELVSRLGPGVEYHAGINNLVSRGAHFRMLGSDARVLFSGYIVGECTGREPLEEFGQDRGCTTIEYERDGNWVAL